MTIKDATNFRKSTLKLKLPQSSYFGKGNGCKSVDLPNFHIDDPKTDTYSRWM